MMIDSEVTKAGKSAEIEGGVGGIVKFSNSTNSTLTVPALYDSLQWCFDDLGESSGVVAGWAVDTIAPHISVEIRILAGNRLVASTLANRHSKDIRAIELGSESAGFVLSLPNEFLDGRKHDISILACVRSKQPCVIAAVTVAHDQATAREPVSDLRPSFGGSFSKTKTLKLSADGARSDFLEAALNNALGRIDELERSQRALNADRTALRTQLKGLSERFSQDLESLSTAPWTPETSLYLGSIVSCVSLTRRRDLWLDELSKFKLSGPVFSLMPHDGAPGPFSILVWGSGGIGDILYLTPIVRELSIKFARCNLFVLHENPAVTEVLENNPYVSGTFCLQGDNLYRFIHRLHSLDIFDLIAEVRYCVTYSAPPLSRIPHEFLRTASYCSSDWQRFVRYQWPHLNNIFANEVMARGVSKLGLVGITSLLPIDSTSELDFFIGKCYSELVSDIADRPFATIHHGSDKRMSATAGVQTKNLPTETWVELVALLHEADFRVVQLGESHERFVEGVDLDLRGKTTLAQTAYVLKQASVHIDTEGGLVHMARAMQTRSVVAFGPTPVGFFGYPQNHNIAAPLCGNCWWTTERWATQCPREMDTPECMVSQSSASIAAPAIEFGQASRGFVATTKVSTLNKVIGELDPHLSHEHSRGLFILARGEDPQLICNLQRPRGEVTFLVPVDTFAEANEHFGQAFLIKPYDDCAISVNSSTMDWIVACGINPFAQNFPEICAEILRCLQPKGCAFISLKLVTEMTVANIRHVLEVAQTRQVGRKYRITWPNEFLWDPKNPEYLIDESLFLVISEHGEAAGISWSEDNAPAAMHEIGPGDAASDTELPAPLPPRHQTFLSSISIKQTVA